MQQIQSKVQLLIPTWSISRLNFENLLSKSVTRVLSYLPFCSNMKYVKHEACRSKKIICFAELFTIWTPLLKSVTSHKMTSLRYWVQWHSGERPRWNVGPNLFPRIVSVSL